MKSNILKAIYYINYAFKVFVLRKDLPAIGGLVITDKCNLNCIHCEIANRGNGNLKFEKARKLLEQMYAEGIRMLYIEGGEPFLWQDNCYKLADVVNLAKQIGYYRVHIYTNGTVSLDSNADVLWLGMDGLGKTYQKIRGPFFNKVMENLNKSSHSYIIINFVINNINKNTIVEMLEWVKNSRRIKGIFFYFHTPYMGINELFIPMKERSSIINTILGYKMQGYPVYNSTAALNAIKNNDWKRPSNVCRIVDITGSYKCCRSIGDPEVCRYCGYAALTEVVMAKKLKLSSIMGLMNYL